MSNNDNDALENARWKHKLAIVAKYNDQAFLFRVKKLSSTTQNQYEYFISEHVTLLSVVGLKRFVEQKTSISSRFLLFSFPEVIYSDVLFADAMDQVRYLQALYRIDSQFCLGLHAITSSVI